MPRTVGRVDRTGVIHITDARLSIWEEGLNPHMTHKERDAWEQRFKREVFGRVIQQMKRIGWTVGPWDQAEHYKCIALSHRTCHKGDLKAQLDISGRTITLEMWQGVNTPTRPDHGGRYEMHKERVAPYLLRLEMDRTRNRIRDYLCNVFTGYSFEDKRQSHDPKPTAQTAMERLAEFYAESWHFKGDDWEGWKAKGMMECNRKAVDGVLLEHGQRAWFKDSKGRIRTGIAHYCSNSGWRFVTGRYSLEYVHTGDIWGSCPDNLRVKRNGRLRRKRLEQELKAAVQRMDFKRAELLKSIVFPAGPLYAIYSRKHDAYFDISYCGYRKSITDAGHYTQEELKPYLGGGLERDGLRAVLVRAES